MRDPASLKYYDTLRTILGVLGCCQGPIASSAGDDVAEAWDTEEEQSVAQVSACHFVGSVARQSPA